MGPLGRGGEAVGAGQHPAWRRSSCRRRDISGCARRCADSSAEPGCRAQGAASISRVAAERSDQALNKVSRKRTEDDNPVHSLTSLLHDLATICANHVQPTDNIPPFTMITTPPPTAPGLRTARRLSPPGLGVVSSPNPLDREIPGQRRDTPANRGNFGLILRSQHLAQGNGFPRRHCPPDAGECGGQPGEQTDP